MNEFVRGAQPPPVEGPPVYDVVAPAVGETLDVTLLSEYAIGVETHWLKPIQGEKMVCVRCTRLEGGCENCGKARLVWLAFVCVFDHKRKSRVILRLGRESMVRLAKAVAPAKTLRGRRWKVWRSGKSPTAPVCFEAHQDPPVSPVPPEMDVKPTLRMILRCAEIPEYTYGAKELRAGEEVMPCP